MNIVPGSSFGLCSKNQHYDDLNGEKKALFKAAERHFEHVFLLDPQRAHYYFERGAARPRVVYEGRDITNLTVLMARSTGGRVASTAMLAHTLDFCGCNIVDPLERFSVGYASKLLTTISRFERGVGSNSYIAFGVEQAAMLIQSLDISARHPIVYKPVTGRKGEGVVAFYALNEIQIFLQKATHELNDPETPFLFQTLEHFVAEYRVLVMHGDILGMVEKTKPIGSITANAAQGGTFVAVQHPEISDFVRENVSHRGLIGVDIARDNEGALHIIESNRAPMWTAFEAATGINVAEEVMRRLIV